MQQELNHKTLGQLDSGAAGAAIDEALRIALNEVDDRGGDGKVRKVTIEVEIFKRDNGQLEVTVFTKVAVPKWRTASTIGNIRMDGKANVKMLFQEYAPEDPDQTTIDQAERE